MAALAVSAVLLNQNGIYILADDNVPAQMMEAEGEAAALTAEQPETEVKTEAPTEAPTPAPTEAPTEAPTPAPTEAPTEAPTPAPTEAPTEAPTPAPTEASTEAPTTTEAPAPTEEITEPATAAPAPQTESADLPEVLETESQAAESETEKKTEIPLLEMDTEDETVSSLSAEAGDVFVTLTLPEGQEASEDAKLIVKEITASEGGAYQNALSLVKGKTEKGHRQTADVIAYQIEVEEDGKKSFPEGTVTLSFAWSKPVNLGILPWMQGEAFVFRLENEAEQIGEIDLEPDRNDDRSFTGFEISGKQLSMIAMAGVQNRVPSGKKMEKSDLLGKLEDLTDYSVVANRFEGGSELPEGLLAGEIVGQENLEETTEISDAMPEEETEDAAETDTSVETEDTVKTNSAEEQDDAGELLAGAVEKSLTLANSVSSGNVTFLTVYADEDGKIDDEPLGAVRVVSDTGKEYLDVTDTMLVINIVAAKADQKLTLPDWQLINTNSVEGAHTEGTAGEVLYNLVAMNGSELRSYEGALTVKEESEGTILAPKAKVLVQKSMAGAVYADGASLENEAKIEGISLGAVYKEAPANEVKLLEAQQELKVADPEPAMGDGKDGENPEDGENTDEQDQKKETMIRFKVKAVLDGSTGKLPENVKFTITDEKGNPLKYVGEKRSREDEVIPATQGFVDVAIETSLYSAFAEKEAGGTVTLKLTPAEIVGNYRFVKSDPEKSAVTVTITPTEGDNPGGVSAEPTEVTFHYEEIPADNTIFALRIYALQSTDKSNLPSGSEAVYVINDEDGKSLTQIGSKTTDTFTLKDGNAVTAVFQASDYKAFTDIQPKTSQEFTVVPQSVTKPWAVKEASQKFTVGRTAEGKYYITDKAGGTQYSGDEIPLNVTFTYNQHIMLTIRALQKSNNEGMAPRSTKFVFKTSDGKTIPVGGKDTITIESKTDKDKVVKGVSLTINTSTTSPFKELLPGDTMKLEIVNTDWPYEWMPDKTSYSIVVSRDKEGTISVWDEKVPKETHAGKGDPLVMPFYYSPEAVTFTAVELDEATKKIGLAGGKISVLLPDGSALNIKIGEMKKTATSVAVENKEGSSVEIPLADNPAFADLLKKNGKVKLTVVALTAPTDPAGYGFSTKSGTEYPLTITKKDGKTSIAANPKTVKLLFKKGSATLTSDSVQVVKYVYIGENTDIFHTGKQNYYVALFKDKKLTQRVTDVKAIAFKGSSLTASTVFNHLEPGKYYVGETEETGRVVGLEKDAKKAKAKKQDYYVEYSTQEVTVNGITNKTIRVNMSNHYFEKPETTEYYGVVKVTKKVLDSDKKAKKSNSTFYFRVNNDKKNIRRINMNGQDTASINVYVRMTDTTKPITITEVKPRVQNGAYVKDSSGNYIFDEMKTNDAWEVSYQNRSLTLRQGQTETPEVVITNREINRKETETDSNKKKESETAAGADTAVITVVKKATYKGNPIRLNSTFYIGIFEDASLKKLKATPMKMTLKNLSEKSREIKVNLYILPKNNRTVTMYFAETDANGKPLSSGQNGYTITPTGGVKVTVDPQHPKATVTFTNNIEGGSSLEDRLRDSSSGLAGDASAIEDSYKGIGGTADGGTGSGTSAKTGDETPLALWFGTLLLGLLTAWLMLRKLSCQQDEKTL